MEGRFCCEILLPNPAGLESSRRVSSVAIVADATAYSVSKTVSVMVSSAVEAGVVLDVFAARAACEVRRTPEIRTSASSVKVPVPTRGRVMATAVKMRRQALWRIPRLFVLT